VGAEYSKGTLFKILF